MEARCVAVEAFQDYFRTSLLPPSHLSYRGRRAALLIAAHDDDATGENPIKRVAGEIKLKSFQNDVHGERESKCRDPGALWSLCYPWIGRTFRRWMPSGGRFAHRAIM